MRYRFVSIFCLATILFSPAAFAYDRSNQGYSVAQADDEEYQAGVPPDDEGVSEEKKAKDIEREIYEGSGGGDGGGRSGAVIGGYVLIAVGGMAAIAGSTIIAATDKNVLGASIAAGGAAMGLAGSLMIMLGSRSGYAVGPAVDPSSGSYGLALAKRF